MNNTLLDCKSKAQALVKSENPPRLEKSRKKGYMRVMKELWDEAGFYYYYYYYYYYHYYYYYQHHHYDHHYYHA